MLRRQPSQLGPRRDDLGHQRERQAQPGEERLVPTAVGGAEELGRGSVRTLPGQRAAESVVAQVGDHQQPRRSFRPALPRLRDELVDRVERQELDARAAEDLRAAEERADLVHDSVGAVVAIADRVLEQLSLAVEEAVVDRPRIDADRLQPAAQLRRRGPPAADAGPDPFEQPREIPSQMTGDPPWGVVETVRLAERQRRATDASDHRAAAARAEVDGKMEDGRGHGKATLSRPRGAPRPAAPGPPAGGSRSLGRSPRDRSRRPPGGGPWPGSAPRPW